MGILARAPPPNPGVGGKAVGTRLCPVFHCGLQAASPPPCSQLSFPVCPQWPKSFLLLQIGADRPAPPPLPGPDSLPCLLAVCEEGFYLHQKSCLKTCPPAFAPGSAPTPLENSLAPALSPRLCVPCHPSCATCLGPAPTQCLSCPAHAHYDSQEQTCSHQTQSSRASPGLGAAGALATPPSNLPILVASLSCAFIVLVFVVVFLVLQLRSGLRGVKVYSLESGGIIAYKGLPSDAWQEGPDEDEEGERTAFIRDQSVL